MTRRTKIAWRTTLTRLLHSYLLVGIVLNAVLNYYLLPIWGLAGLVYATALGNVPATCRVIEGAFWSRPIARHHRSRLRAAVWAALIDQM